MHSYYLYIVSALILLANLFILRQWSKACKRGYLLLPLLLPMVFFSFWPQIAYRFPPQSKLWSALAMTGNIWQVLTLFSILAFAVVGLVLLMRRLIRRAAALRRSPVPAGRRLFVVFLLTILCTVYAVYETHSLSVTSLEIRTEKLAPGSDPVRVVFVTDVHLHEFTGPDRLRTIVDRIESLKPDIVLNGGDLVDADMSDRERDAAILAELKPPYGSYGVTGNHEARHGTEGNSLPFMRRAGIRVLRQEAVEIGGITLVGVDDPDVAADSGKDLTDAMPVLKALDDESFVILLRHNPRIDPAWVGGFQLLLAGHTHGGQIWPFRHLIKRSYGMPQGELFEMAGPNGSSLAYISAGTGFGRTPFRFLTPPEIVVIDIVPALAEAGS